MFFFFFMVLLYIYFLFFLIFMNNNYGKPFSYLPFNEKLPSIQTSIKECSDKVENGINTLKLGFIRKPKIVNHIKVINNTPDVKKQHRKVKSDNIFSTTPTFKIKSKVFINPKKHYNDNLILNSNEKDNNIISNNNTLSEFQNLTITNYKRSRNKSNDLLSNYDSNSINHYFLTTLRTLTEDAIDEIDNLNYEKKENDKYENKMIKKCDKRLKTFNDKLVIDTDQYITERFVPGKNNFNKHFDKLILGNKNFDIKTMVKILRERRKPKNKIMHEIQFQKIEEKHRNFIRMVEHNEMEVKKVRKYYFKLRSKNKY